MISWKVRLRNYSRGKETVSFKEKLKEMGREEGLAIQISDLGEKEGVCAKREGGVLST